jgi:GH35 family endo-1,4-beta-xylanase
MMCWMNWRRIFLWLAEKDMQISGHNLLWSNVSASDVKSKNHQEKLQTDLKHV